MYYQKTMLIVFVTVFFMFLTSDLVLQVKQTSLSHGLLNALFPPNLDFKISSNDASEGGDKVKEAVTTSLEKGKAAVEESAKSAADVTKGTAQKLKDTFSSSSDL
ncbi:hypothetical protein HanXRQr2_Chr03g0120051 [Helianthus annuus]|uniref:Uncharacterized protein n=1 Tax=Helianthus annuus TaxID=4232 RepID=A0A251V7S5_HELAN|nr:uncharacterized protein LOC110928035 [Helianthus annuus]KAF5815169.1 hypothetical protein HanXRQr2_Chr03g0120051 [Helianthus annuus]